MTTRRDLLLTALLSTLGAKLARADQDQSSVVDQVHKGMVGREQIAMLLYEGFTALDLFGPHHMFSAMTGAKVHLVAETMSPVSSDTKVKVAPTMTFDECPNELTILFVPGGTTGTLAAARSDAVRAFVSERGAKAEWVASVCTGSIVLGAAGLLRGYQATSHWLALDALRAFGATPVPSRVVVDRNRVTGAGVTAGLDFGLQLVGQLRNKEYAQAVQLFAEYDPQPPFDQGHPDKAAPEVVQMFRAAHASFTQQAERIAADLSGNGKSSN